ncbi:MAG: DUF3048 domain-containing protein [Parcubacteria group bacterium]
MKLDRRSYVLLWTGFFCIAGLALATGVARAMIVNGALAGLSADRSSKATTTAVGYSDYTGLPLYSKSALGSRALGVMIAGDPITRPQSGIGQADIVVEMEAAPGITRLLAIFQSVLPKEIGSIRSARNDYIDLAAGFDAVLVHWGGEKRALERLAASDTAEVDQFANGDLFYRKLNVPAPHNGFTSGDYLEEGLERYDYERAPKFDAWEFSQDAPLAERPAGGTLELTYGSGDFDVTYEYDQASNSYQRHQGGAPHTDANTGKMVQPKNVLVLRANYFVYSSAGAYLQFDIAKGGECSLYQNGQELDCKWQKGQDESDPIVLKEGKTGRKLPLVAGQTWIQVMLPTAAVTWTPTPVAGLLQ